MGYRHQVISDTMCIKSDRLPVWFKDKYSRYIDFDRDYWASYTENKRYGVFIELEKDIQKALIEIGASENETVRLVFFADESDEDCPDISHVTITINSMVEIVPTGWKKNGK